MSDTISINMNGIPNEERQNKVDKETQVYVNFEYFFYLKARKKYVYYFHQAGNQEDPEICKKFCRETTVHGCRSVYMHTSYAIYKIDI